MKYIKMAFLYALFNYFLVGAVVLATKQYPGASANVVTNAAPTVSIVSPIETVVPTKKIIRVQPTTKQTDPFAAIPNQTTGASAPTSAPIAANPTSAPHAAPTADSRCIISIDGQRYDITQFRFSHSGGNIFQCGTDMSATFHGQHPNSYLQIMAAYKI